MGFVQATFDEAAGIVQVRSFDKEANLVGGMDFQRNGGRDGIYDRLELHDPTATQPLSQSVFESSEIFR